MSRNIAPALWPAVAILLGIRLSGLLTSISPALWLALLALAIAWWRAPGRWLACLALGVLCGWVQREQLEQGTENLRPERAVELVARSIDHPRRDEEGWLLRVAVLHLKQQRRIFGWPQEVWLRLPESDQAPPGFGTTIRVRGHLRRSVGYANRAPIRPGPWRLRVKSWRLLKVEREASGWARLAAALHRRADTALTRAEPASNPRPGIALVRALVLGQRHALPKNWQQGLQRAGLGHLAAVSGLHVGILLGLIWGGAWFLPRPLRLFLAIISLAAYLLLVGPHPSVDRAAVMAVLCTLALWIERPPTVLNALACCAAGMALSDPAVIDRLGFRLSVSATAGILLLAPRFERRWTKLPIFWRRSLSASLAAQVATLPWILPLTGGWHPSSLWLNLIAAPWLVLVLALAFPFLVLSIATPDAARLLLPALDLLAAPIAQFSAQPASNAWYLPWATWPGCFGLVVLVLLVGCSLWPENLWAASLIRIRSRCGPILLRMVSLSAVLLSAVVLASVLFLVLERGQGRPEGEIILFDVGQGDAILLRDGDHSLLVDGGGWPNGDFGGRVLLPALAAEGIRGLDAVLLTHPDLDHCGGLADLLHYLPTSELWSGPGWPDSCGEELLTLTAAPWRPLWRGQRLRMGEWKLEVLHPTPGSRRGRNDRSVVIMAQWHEVRLLLTGDIEAATERRLLRHYGDALQADVLKIAHHGSKTSTSAAFLAAVRPRLALISAGVANPYGHPTPTVLERLGARGTRVLRSDKMGAVHLGLDRPGRVAITLPASPR